MTAESGAPRARRAWVFFDFAQQPFHTLVTTFVFGPYFAAHVAATPAEGQAMWGYAVAAAGAVVALGAPRPRRRRRCRGALQAVDRGALSRLRARLLRALAGVPGPAAPILLVLVAYAAGLGGGRTQDRADQRHDAGLAAPGAIGRLSGTGWGFGYTGGDQPRHHAGLLRRRSGDGRTLAGFAPVFGLDAQSHEGDRLAGPYTALWYLVFVLPLFLFVPDAPGAARSVVP